MEKEMGVAPIDGVPAVPGRDGHGRPLLHLMWVGFSAMAFWAGELLRALPLAQGGGGGAAVHLLVPYVMWLLAFVVTLTAVAPRTLPRAVVIDVADHQLAYSFLSMAVFAGGLLRALAEVEADDEALLVDAAAAARLVGAYAIFLLALVATLMPVVGLPRRAIPSATFMLLSAVIWYHLQLWLP